MFIPNMAATETRMRKEKIPVQRFDTSGISLARREGLAVKLSNYLKNDLAIFINIIKYFCLCIQDSFKISIKNYKYEVRCPSPSASCSP